MRRPRWRLLVLLRTLTLVGLLRAHASALRLGNRGFYFPEDW